MTYYCKKHGVTDYGITLYSDRGTKGEFCQSCVIDFWREHIGVLTETPPPPAIAPCPFCGGMGCGYTQSEFGRENEPYYVFCAPCEAAGPDGATPADAIAKWNQRA